MDKPSSNKPVWVLLLVVAVLATAAGALHLTGGPITVSSGVVKSVGPAANGGAAAQAASVVLGGGAVVNATVSHDFSPRPGQEVLLRVQRHVISATSTYEVVGPIERK